MSLPFVKMEGAENDFIFIEAQDGSPDLNGGELAKRLCPRKTGIGADGLVIIHDYQTKDSLPRFSWDFYNSDGSSAEMCGNAARCAVLFSKLKSNHDHCEFETAIGTLSGQWRDDEATVLLPLAKPEVRTLKIELGHQDVEGLYVDSGVPHFVVSQKTYKPFPHATALALQQHSSFQPKGANITFLELSGSPQRTVSFERGVEDFTKACGTGAIACALALQHHQGVQKVTLQAPGGRLTVHLQENNIALSGPARRVCQGEAFPY